MTFPTIAYGRKNPLKWCSYLAQNMRWIFTEALGPAETGTAWDDLRFPATAINPLGQVSDPDIDTTYGTLLFATDEVIFALVQLPHTWKEGTALTPHVHWYKTTSAAGDVNWQLEYRWAPIGEVFDASWTTLNTESTVAGTPDTDTANKHLISSFGDVSATGKTISDMLIMKISRVAATGSEYGTDAALLEFDVHYQADSRGSAQPFIKLPA